MIWELAPCAGLLGLAPDNEGAGYTVTVPALPGRIREGQAGEECIVNAQEGIHPYLDDLPASDDADPGRKGDASSNHGNHRR